MQIHNKWENSGEDVGLFHGAFWKATKFPGEKTPNKYLE